MADRHEQFKQLIQDCFEATQEPTIQAILRFYEQWNPETFEQPDVDPADNFTFEVHGIGQRAIGSAVANEGLYGDPAIIK